MRPTLRQTSHVLSLLATVACGSEIPTATSSSHNLVGAAGANAAEIPQPIAAEPQAAAVRAASDVAEPVADAAPGVQPDTTTQYAARYSQYIAFGDSFTSGFGLSGVKPKSCAQSKTAAWPPLVNKGLGITNPLIFAACSGATTQDIMAKGPDVTPGYQTGPQIDQLPAQNDSALITIQIGGNDLKLGESIQECLTGLDGLKKTAGTPASITALTQLSPQCAKLDWLLSNFSAVVEEQLEPSLEYTFSALRAKAPNATIVAVGYPHLVDATSRCRGVLGLFVNAKLRQRMNDLADALNAKIASAAATAGIVSLTDQVVSAFKGHEMCSGQEWVSSLTVHPNAQGHKAFAKLVIDGVPAAPTRTAATDVGTDMPSVPPEDVPAGQEEPGIDQGPLPQPGDDEPIDQDPLPQPGDDEPIDQDPLPQPGDDEPIDQAPFPQPGDDEPIDQDPLPQPGDDE